MTTDNPAAELDRYAMTLLRMSQRIVGALHDDLAELPGLIDQTLIIPAPRGVDPAVALVTVLAAQVDPDTTAEQRLGWVRACAPPAAGAKSA